jgi:hypothetical protein
MVKMLGLRQCGANQPWIHGATTFHVGVNPLGMLLIGQYTAIQCHHDPSAAASL